MLLHTEQNVHHFCILKIPVGYWCFNTRSLKANAILGDLQLHMY